MIYHIIYRLFHGFGKVQLFYVVFFCCFAVGHLRPRHQDVSHDTHHARGASQVGSTSSGGLIDHRSRSEFLPESQRAQQFMSFSDDGTRKIMENPHKMYKIVVKFDHSSTFHHIPIKNVQVCPRSCSLMHWFSRT